jgi:hypothetical protein
MLAELPFKIVKMGPPALGSGFAPGPASRHDPELADTPFEFSDAPLPFDRLLGNRKPLIN